MCLSNSRSIQLSILLISLLLAACGGSETGRTVEPAVEVKPVSEFPFATTEPAEFLADIVVTNGDVVSEYRYFKKDARRKIDFITDGRLSRTELVTDRVYLIDHDKKEFAAREKGSGNAADIVASPYAMPAFTSPVRYRFTRIGTQGDLVTYRVETGSTDGVEAVVTVDPKTNLMVKQEFRSGTSLFIYEIKRAESSVADAEFALPNGYKQK